MSPRSKLQHAILDTALIVVFLGFLAAPTVDRFLRPDTARGPEPERRQPVARPAWVLTPHALTYFPDRFKPWFDDTFGLRDVFLRWNSIVKVFLLHTSPSRDLVLGEDGWWLYRGAGALDDWRGLLPLEEEELETWRKTLEANRDRLARRGIEYLFAIGPNKETIYPEKVPGRFNRVGPTRLDQLVRHLERHSNLRILDLRAALLAEKSGDSPDDELYFKNGTHWNARGAMVACREILGRLDDRFPALEPVDPSALEKAPCPDLDSWAPTMYIPDLVPPSAKFWRFRSGPRSRVVQSTGPHGQGQRRITEIDDPRLPSAVFVHDSFGQSVEPLLEESFRRFASYWSNTADLVDVDRERPDVFVQLFVERSLVPVPPDYYRIRTERSEYEAFEGSSRTLFRLRHGDDTARLTTTPGLIVAGTSDPAGGGIELRVRSEKPLLRLPELELPSDSDLVVALELTSPAETQASLLDETDEGPRSFPARRATASVDTGRNRLYLRLDPRSIRGRLVIRPGVVPGKYRLHDVEIRCVDRLKPD